MVQIVQRIQPEQNIARYADTSPEDISSGIKDVGKDIENEIKKNKEFRELLRAIANDPIISSQLSANDAKTMSMLKKLAPGIFETDWFDKQNAGQIKVVPGNVYSQFPTATLPDTQENTNYKNKVIQAQYEGIDVDAIEAEKQEKNFWGKLEALLRTAPRTQAAVGSEWLEQSEKEKERITGLLPTTAFEPAPAGKTAKDYKSQWGKYDIDPFTSGLPEQYQEKKADFGKVGKAWWDALINKEGGKWADKGLFEFFEKYTPELAEPKAWAENVENKGLARIIADSINEFRAERGDEPISDEEFGFGGKSENIVNKLGLIAASLFGNDAAMGSLTLEIFGSPETFLTGGVARGGTVVGKAGKAIEVASKAGKAGKVVLQNVDDIAKTLRTAGMTKKAAYATAEAIKAGKIAPEALELMGKTAKTVKPYTLLPEGAEVVLSKAGKATVGAEAATKAENVITEAAKIANEYAQAGKLGLFADESKAIMNQLAKAGETIGTTGKVAKQGQKNLTLLNQLLKPKYTMEALENAAKTMPYEQAKALIDVGGLRYGLPPNMYVDIIPGYVFSKATQKAGKAIASIPKVGAGLETFAKAMGFVSKSPAQEALLEVQRRYNYQLQKEFKNTVDQLFKHGTLSKEERKLLTWYIDTPYSKLTKMVQEPTGKTIDKIKKVKQVFKSMEGSKKIVAEYKNLAAKIQAIDKQIERAYNDLRRGLIKANLIENPETAAIKGTSAIDEIGDIMPDRLSKDMFLKEYPSKKLWDALPDNWKYKPKDSELFGEEALQEIQQTKGVSWDEFIDDFNAAAGTSLKEPEDFIEYIKAIDKGYSADELKAATEIADDLMEEAWDDFIYRQTSKVKSDKMYAKTVAGKYEQISALNEQLAKMDELIETDKFGNLWDKGTAKEISTTKYLDVVEKIPEMENVMKTTNVPIGIKEFDLIQMLKGKGLEGAEAKKIAGDYIAGKIPEAGKAGKFATLDEYERYLLKAINDGEIDTSPNQLQYLFKKHQKYAEDVLGMEDVAQELVYGSSGVSAGKFAELEGEDKLLEMLSPKNLNRAGKQIAKDFSYQKGIDALNEVLGVAAKKDYAKLQEIAESVQKMFKDWGIEENARGILKELRDWYTPGRLPKEMIPKSIKNKVEKGILGKKKQIFEFKKVIPSIAQRVALGIPTEQDVFKLTFTRLQEHIRATMRQDMATVAKRFGKTAEQLSKEEQYGIRAWQTVTAPELKGLYFEPEVAKTLENLKLSVSDDFIKNLLHHYDRSLNWLKAYMTVGNVGFHMRNFYSNFWLLFLKDGFKAFSPESMLRAIYVQFADESTAVGKKIANTPIATIDGVTYTAKEVQELAEEFAVIRGGLLRADVAESVVNQAQRLMQPQWKRALNYVNPASRQFAPLKLGDAFGGFIEDNARTIGFLNDLDAGSDIRTAAARTRRFMIDYSDLTDTERALNKRLQPFYSWLRKNITLQVSEMGRQPGKFALIEKVKRYFEAISDEPDETFLPDFMKDLGAWLLPLKANGLPVYLNPNMPFQDIEKLGNLIMGNWDKFGQDLFNSLTPFAKWLMELSPMIASGGKHAGKEFFFGRDISVNQYKPAQAVLQLLGKKLPVEKLPGVERDASGTVMTNELVDYALRQNPFVYNISKSMPPGSYETPTTREQYIMQMLSAYGGIKLMPYDVQKSKGYYEQDIANQIGIQLSKKKQLGEDVVDIPEIETALREIFTQNAVEKTGYKDLQELEYLMDMLGGTKEQRLLLNLLKQPYKDEMSKIKYSNIEKLQQLLKEQGIQPTKEELQEILKQLQQQGK
jgi:hypothetical protein